MAFEIAKPILIDTIFSEKFSELVKKDDGTNTTVNRVEIFSELLQLCVARYDIFDIL